ncbi:DUF1700 domain-containing protein [Vallitalea okinawensis]|uniref:DUF1700 domain-containing protein n=1 Tax=Vallitalea okinawensis TaxID=2078660 RepID=UPI000CFAA20F|nr:DUF1700 domain-containing protein [Vallitalea okinawensis]
MNKKEFLDILKDYLEDHFSQYELNDILRDYEEYFLNGEIEGKSEEEVIKALGSPKAIARDLIQEMRTENGATNKNQESFKDSALYYKIVEFWGNIKRNIGPKFKRFNKTVGERCIKIKEAINRHLPSNIQIRIRPKSPSWLKKLFYILLTVVLLFPAGFIIGGILLAGGALFFGTLCTIAAYPASLLLGQIGDAFTGLGLSLSLFATGLLLLFWIVYGSIFGVMKYCIVQYISWLKTRFMYIRVGTRTDLIPELDYEGSDGYEA